MVVSDGQLTAGDGRDRLAAALDYADRRGVPLYAVLVGDPTPPKDLTVVSLHAPREVRRAARVELTAVPTGDFGIYLIRMHIKRLSGQATTWVRINRGFLNEMRKQFMLWWTLSPEMKAEYTEEAQAAFA